MAIEVIKPGLATSVQDAGRPGYYNIGIPISGGLDQYSLRAANLLVGNDAGTPLLETAGSGILSAVIFNAVIIVALVPLALRGVKYQAMSAEALLRRNLWIYGVGGIIVPFIGIKIIDVIITTLRLA